MMLERLRKAAITFDTTVLLPLMRTISGTASEEQLRRGEAYRRTEVDLIAGWIAAAAERCILPHVLAETSNLLSQKSGRERRRNALAANLKEWSDASVSANDILPTADYRRFGATDAALLVWLAEAENRLVVTEDARLHVHAAHKGLNMVNFSHYREANT